MKKYEIVKKKVLTPEISQISVYAPLVAAKAKAGQFIILRVDEEGERIPLTISSAVDGLVTVIYQKIGGTTLALDQLNEGDCLQDFVDVFLVQTFPSDFAQDGRRIKTEKHFQNKIDCHKYNNKQTCIISVFNEKHKSNAVKDADNICL